MTTQEEINILQSEMKRTNIHVRNDIKLFSPCNFIEGKFPSANEMGALAEAKYKKSDIEDVAYFEPYYLKDFVAIKKKG